MAEYVLISGICQWQSGSLGKDDAMEVFEK